MLTAVATKSLKIVIFGHLVLVDANCDDSVTIPRCPNLVVDLKVSVALFARLRVHFGHPPISNSGSTPGGIGQKMESLLSGRVYLDHRSC